jgi:hypothetical protein
MPEKLGSLNDIMFSILLKHFIKKSNKNFQLDPALYKLLKIAVKWKFSQQSGANEVEIR